MNTSTTILNKDLLMFFMFSKKLIVTLLFTLAFSVQAIAGEMTKMQKAGHASPMPGLMMIINMNANQLGLDNEQLEMVHNWRRTHQQPVQDLVSEIVSLESEIKQSVLEGVTPSEMKALKNDLLDLRGELMDIKYRCVSTMKKTFDDEQWAQLMKLRKRGLRVANSDKGSTNEIQAFLRVSPMPKLMAIILMHKKDLEITKKQHEQLEEWRLEHMNHWALLFEKILNTEKKITQQSLEMAPNASLMKQFDKMAKHRRKMAQMSLDCRDNMKKVLSDSQWEEMVRLLKSYI